MVVSIPSPFAESAPYYPHRAPYAPEALTFIVETFRLGNHSAVLDLGCGPGTIAIPLSRVVGCVLAIDPSAEMLAEGRRLAAREARLNIEWLQSPAESITSNLGQFAAATLGQSFHWMDRDRVLVTLEAAIAPGGGIALVNPGKRKPQESWEPIADALVDRYIARPKRHPDMNPELKHEPALLRSRSFAQFSTREFGVDVVRDVNAIIACVYSMSSSPPSAFGSRRTEFEEELTAALLDENPSGVFHERVETEVLWARIASP